jgi:hypothetical protein
MGCRKRRKRERDRQEEGKECGLPDSYFTITAFQLSPPAHLFYQRK